MPTTQPSAAAPAPFSVSVPQSAKDFLRNHCLAGLGDTPVWTPLRGGVSSELWRVDLPTRTVCVKGALAQLKVAGDWQAPTSRNAVEWEWLTYAAGVVPDPFRCFRRVRLKGG